MKTILFDARSQQSTHPTGVGIYTRHIATHLLKTDLGPQLTFFQNSSQPINSPLPQNQTITTHIPNKLLNACITLTSKPTLNSLTNHTTHNPIFLPNINFIATNSPYILTIHDLSFKHFPHWYAPKMRIWHALTQPTKLIKNAQHIICVSHATAQDVQQTFAIPSSRITVIYPGICSQKNIPSIPKEPFFLSIGSIEPRKNHTALLHAFSRVISKPTFKNIRLKLIGPAGYQSQNIFKLIKQLNIQNNVEWLNYVDTETKHALLSQATALIYPSLYEGFGFPPLEAMSHGTPVISSWSSSMKEVCGHHALLTNPYNYDEIADAMIAILDDTQLAQQLASEGKQYATQFTWEKTANQTAELLKQYL